MRFRSNQYAVVAYRVVGGMAALAILAGAPAAGAGVAYAQDGVEAADAEANVIRFGDAVRIRVFLPDVRDAPLNTDVHVAVDERGEVVIPRLGRRAVGGLSAADARRTLSAELQEVYPNSVVEVTILRRVLVHGAVRRPGSYLLASYEATVGDAIASAEGISPEGRTNLVRVLRDDRVLSVRLGGAERLAAFTLRSGDEVVVPERGWITRQPGLAAALLSSAVSLLVTVIIVAQ
jgi:protein involved in polysaccharide export with SLBB domain